MWCPEGALLTWPGSTCADAASGTRALFPCLSHCSWSACFKGIEHMYSTVHRQAGLKSDRICHLRILQTAWFKWCPRGPPAAMNANCCYSRHRCFRYARKTKTYCHLCTQCEEPGVVNDICAACFADVLGADFCPCPGSSLFRIQHALSRPMPVGF